MTNGTFHNYIILCQVGSFKSKVLQNTPKYSTIKVAPLIRSMLYFLN